MLSDRKLVNTNRGLLTYSGYYKDKRVTVSTHGMGGPSASIVFEELRMMGAKIMVRLGTTGALVKDLKVGNFVVPTGAGHLKGSLASYGRTRASTALPDGGLQGEIAERCSSEGVDFKRGLVFSSDAFYAENRSSLKPWIERGAISVEMECATLFTLGRIRGFRSAALLIVSNSKAGKGDNRLATAERLRPYVERGGRIVLDTLVDIA